MEVRRSEHRHHTDEQVTDVILKALELVEALEVPQDLRGPAFVQACGLFAQKSIVAEPAGSPIVAMGIPRGV